MVHALSSFVDEMARVFEAEGRADGAALAVVLKTLPQDLWLQGSDCGADSAIRDLLGTSAMPVAQAALEAHDVLGWAPETYASRTPDLAALSPYVVADLLGPEQAFRCDHLRAGLYYQKPNTRYGLHSHAAEETYVIIAGAATWTAGERQRLLLPGDYVHHTTYLPHACETGPEGVVALWRWSGEIGKESYRVHDGQGAFAA
ncbi:dimethylsulfonioproprionate lyase family protein [Marinibacterium profundimaris]|uniref:dimethylsulfonioproprionate lyase family protein n=1 Tax=Marinibacterium profundimaris TaxID=1679460 RepID=UPI000B523081|nr:dimethylsulfonioproprionate lyase family protein [Marinibacterium profundimaris]